MNRTLLLSFLILGLPAVATAQRGPDTPDPVADDAVTKRDPAIQAVDKFLKGKGKPAKADGWRQRMTRPEVLPFAADKRYEWHLRTNQGEVAIRLLPEVAPMHVSSTIYLTRAGYYDGLTFHRVIPGFMAQGGCPIGSGSGGPGYLYDGEFDPKVVHDRPGLLSMANAGPKTDGSQFFLTFVKTPHLDGKHTIFGEVTAGMDVLKKLEAAGSPSGRPQQELVIEQAWVVVTPAPEPEQEPESGRGEGEQRGGGGKGRGRSGGR